MKQQLHILLVFLLLMLSFFSSTQTAFFDREGVTGAYVYGSKGNPVITTEIDPLTGALREKMIANRAPLGSVSAAGRDEVFLKQGSYFSTQQISGTSISTDFGGKGDVNCDGDIDLDDYHSLLLVVGQQSRYLRSVGEAFKLRNEEECYIPRKTTLTGARYVKQGDMNNDGRMDSMDVKLLHRHVKDIGSENYQKMIVQMSDCSPDDAGQKTCAMAGSICTCAELVAGRYYRWECERCPGGTKCVGGGHDVGGDREAACEERVPSEGRGYSQ